MMRRRIGKWRRKDIESARAVWFAHDPMTLTLHYTLTLNAFFN